MSVITATSQIALACFLSGLLLFAIRDASFKLADWRKVISHEGLEERFPFSRTLARVFCPPRKFARFGDSACSVRFDETLCPVRKNPPSQGFGNKYLRNSLAKINMMMAMRYGNAFLDIEIAPTNSRRFEGNERYVDDRCHNSAGFNGHVSQFAR